jgi:hypothetical protein
MNVSDYWREQSRKRRLRARENGRCIICMTREARAQRVTCERCCAAATAATKRRRAELGANRAGVNPGDYLGREESRVPVLNRTA